jgi:predicted RNA methylase
MAANAQKRLIRKLDLELFLATLKTQPKPQVRLEQYTTSEQVAANMLYLAAYQNGDIVQKKVLDLGCGKGWIYRRSFLGSRSWESTSFCRLSK